MFKVKLSLKKKLVLLSILLTIIIVALTTSISLSIYLGEFKRNNEKTLNIMNDSLDERLKKSSKVSENIINSKIQQLELFANIISNNETIQKNVKNGEALSSTEFFRLAGKIKKDYFYFDLNYSKDIEIEIVTKNGKVRGKTDITESFSEKNNSFMIDKVLKNGLVLLSDISSTEDGLVIKTYQAIIEGGSGISTQNQGIVILSNPINTNFARELKSIVDDEIIVYNKANFLTSSFDDNDSLEGKKENKIFKSLDTVVIQDKKVFNQNFKAAFIPIKNSLNKKIGMIEILTPLDKLEKSIEDFKKSAEVIKYNMIIRFIFIGIILTIFGSFITFKVVNIVAQNIETILNAINKIAKGDLSQRLTIKSGDEIEYLANNINDMAIQLEISFEREKKWNQELEKKVIERTVEIANKNEELKKLDKLKDEFLANTSHELRTPLNGIIGIAESLVDGIGGDLSDKTKKNLYLIISSGQRLATLINDILDFSKIRNREHAIELNMKNVNINYIVEFTLTMFQPLIIGKNIKLINEIPQDFVAYTDENRFQQVMNNLIGNAVKFTEEGYVRVYAKSDKNDFFEIFVEDTGIGISEDKLDTIFNPFEQGDGSASRKYSGTGLGLSITKQLVELWKGKIKVSSILKKGSIFSFTLPQNIDEKQEMEPGNTFLSQREKYAFDISEITPENKENENLTSKKGRILIVDDELINLKVLENILLLKGYDIDKATNGFDAIKMIGNGMFKYDLIILDIMMPKMSGYEACKLIRERYSLYEIPILLLTAKVNIEDIREGFLCGANDYLKKPVEKEELYARVQTLVNLKRLVIDFAKSIVHEIRTPLVSIKGFSSIGKQRLISSKEKLEQIDFEKISDCFDTINSESDRIDEMASDILEQADPESIDIKIEELNLKEIIEKQLSKMEKDIKLNNIKVVKEIDSNIYLNGDKTRTLKMFYHLIKNAVEASDMLEENKYLKISAFTNLKSIKILIEDNGVGIKADIKDRIFDPLFTTKTLGTGYGLNIVKNYLEQISGTIKLVKEYEPTIFEITIDK